MTPAEQALRDAWISEMWTPVREVPKEVREHDYTGWTAAAAREGYVSCHACGVVFRQPSGVKSAYKWCPECVEEVGEVAS